MAFDNNTEKVRRAAAMVDLAGAINRANGVAVAVNRSNGVPDRAVHLASGVPDRPVRGGPPSGIRAEVIGLSARVKSETTLSAGTLSALYDDVAILHGEIHKALILARRAEGE